MLACLDVRAGIRLGRRQCRGLQPAFCFDPALRRGPQALLGLLPSAGYRRRHRLAGAPGLGGMPEFAFRCDAQAQGVAGSLVGVLAGGAYLAFDFVGRRACARLFDGVYFGAGTRQRSFLHRQFGRSARRGACRGLAMRLRCHLRGVASRLLGQRALSRTGGQLRVGAGPLAGFLECELLGGGALGGCRGRCPRLACDRLRGGAGGLSPVSGCFSRLTRVNGQGGVGFDLVGQSGARLLLCGSAFARRARGLFVGQPVPAQLFDLMLRGLVMHLAGGARGDLCLEALALRFGGRLVGSRAFERGCRYRAVCLCPRFGHFACTRFGDGPVLGRAGGLGLGLDASKSLANRAQFGTCMCGVFGVGRGGWKFNFIARIGIVGERGVAGRGFQSRGWCHIGLRSLRSRRRDALTAPAGIT